MFAVGVRVVAVALVALVAALVLGWSPLVSTSLVLLGGVYAAGLSVDEASLDGASPVFAAGLYLIAELGYWSLEEREGAKGEPGDGPRRLAFVAALGIGAFFVAAALLALVDVVRARGLAVDVVGAAAAAAVLLAVVLIARRKP